MNDVSNFHVNSFEKGNNKQIGREIEWVVVNGRTITWTSEIKRLASLDRYLKGRMEWTATLSDRCKDNFIVFAEKYLFKKIAKEENFNGIIFFDRIKQIRKENRCGLREAIRQFAQSNYPRIQFYQSSFQCKPQKAALIADCVESLNLNQDGQKANELIDILEEDFDLQRLPELFSFIQKNKKNWHRQATKTQKPIYLRQRNYAKLIPRTIQYNCDGTIYLLFNKINEWDPLLGEGTCKKAKLALELTTVKKVVRLTEWISNTREIEMIARFKNCEGIMQLVPNTSLFYPVSGDRKDAKIGYMVKYYNAGDLDECLEAEKTNASLTKKDKFFIAKRFLFGLYQMHQAGILHRDIKAANILVNRNPNTKEVDDCVINDLGFACEMKDQVARSQTPGTPLTMSPEYLLAAILKRGELRANHFSNDCWGAGVVLYQLFKSLVPDWESLPNDPHWFEAESLEELNNDLQDLQEEWLPRPQNSNSIGHLICDLLNPNPQKRMKIGEALERIKNIEDLDNLLEEMVEQLQNFKI